MCLGIPVPIVKLIDQCYAEVKIGAVSKKINVSMVEGAAVGDFVILHAGFAISIISPEEAEKTYKMLESIEKGNEIIGL